jgi:hypothetical protein
VLILYDEKLAERVGSRHDQCLIQIDRKRERERERAIEREIESSHSLSNSFVIFSSYRVIAVPFINIMTLRC